MTPAPLPSPIERFLGRESMRGGPFGLLRLTPETCTDDRIIASLEWQLDRVAQHAEGDTPEADQVRLALHAAAAQLLDPNVRRHVLASLRAGEARRPTGAAGPGAPGGAATGLEEDALRTLALYGGWNRQSLDRLKALAHARGMGSKEVALTLQQMSMGSRGQAPTTTGAPAASAGAGATSRPGPGRPAPRQSGSPLPDFDPGARHVRNLLLGIAGAIVAVVSVVVIAAVLLSSKGSGNAAQQQASQGTPAAPAPKPAAPDAPKTSGPEKQAPADSRTAQAPPTAPAKPTAAKEAPTDAAFVDPQALVRSLAECAAQARREPDVAADRFPALAKTLGARWAKLDTAQRRSADVAVLEIVFATASYPDASTRVLDALGDGASRLAGADAIAPQDVWPAVWSVGILTRVSRERELPHAFSSDVDARLTASIGEDRPRTGASFEAGALAALRRIPDRLFAGEATQKEETGRKADAMVKPWIEAVSAISGTDAEAKERLLVDGLQRILTLAPDPGENQRVFDAVQTLVTEIKWRKGGAARPRLLDWFRDPRVSMQDLQVVTGALTSRSSAEGVDPMMVLSVGAAPADRQRLRATYAKAWGIAESVGENKAAAEWLEGGAGELARSTEGLRPLEFLIMAAQLARLNDASTRLWRGETDIVSLIVDEAVDLPNSSVARLGAQVRKGLTESVEGDGQWTTGYLSLGRNAALRQEKLNQIEKHALTMGPVDAEQLMWIACFESPIELRTTAQRAVGNLSSHAAIVNAALEILPRAPRYASVGALFEKVASRSLPRPSEASWELETRRALVARLLELLAATGEDTRVNELANLIFEAYAARANATPSEEGRAEGATRGSDAANELCRTWRMDAEAVAPNEHAPVSLDTIDRRRQGRLRLSQGPIQTFAGEQVTTAELMAYVVSAEHPPLAQQVKDVIDEMATARRQSRHIFEQLVHAERAMLKLWRLRITGGQP